MTKETLLAMLIAVFGNTKPNLTERTMNDYIENVMLASAPEDKDKLDEFVKGHANVLKSMAGQIATEVKDGVLAGVEKHKQDNPPATPTANPPADDASALSAQLKAMQDTIDGLTSASQKDADSKKIQETIASARKALEEKGANHEFTFKQTERLLKVDASTSVEDLTDAWEKEYNSFFAEMKGNGANPMGGGGGQSNLQGEKDLEAFKLGLQDKGSIPNSNK